MRRYLLLASVLILLPTVSSARTWYILPDGSGDAPTIQEGINRAEVGDTVLVGPGTYYENIEFMGRDIVLKSEMGPEVTTIDGSHKEDSVVKIWKGETRAAVLEGLTIRNGRGYRETELPDSDGGGLYCRYSDPLIQGNIFSENETVGQGLGGGIYAQACNVILLGNRLISNTSSQNGGGIALREGDYTIADCYFKNNHAYADGGGVWFWQADGHLELIHSEFWDNSAGDHGGGTYLSERGASGPSMIRENLFVRNRTSGTGFIGDTGSGGAIAALRMSGEIVRNTFVRNDGHHLSSGGGGGLLLFLTDASLTVSHNIFYQNIEDGIACWWGATVTLQANILWQDQGGELGEGDHTCPEDWALTQRFEDPQFCNPGTDDYHVAQSSPALAGPEVFGAFDTPGCTEVPRKITTWGRLKSMYQSIHTGLRRPPFL